MDRRALLKGGSGLAAHAAFPGLLAAFAARAEAADATPVFLSPQEMRAVRALVDVILPATDSPSGSAAMTHVFVDMALADCATPEQQATFRAGLAELGAFADASPERQVELLKARTGTPFFRLLKDYAVTGYFNSKPGATEACAYVAIPGRYEGCVELKPGQKAWQES